LLGYFALQVKFEEDISKILPKDKKIEKLNEGFLHSKFLDKLVITVSLKDTASAAQPDSLVTYAGVFVRKLQEKLSPYISRINDKVDDGLAMELYGTISDHLPVYLDNKDYGSVDSLTVPATVKKTLEQNFRTLTSPAGIALKEIISNDPVGISFLGLKKLQQLGLTPTDIHNLEYLEDREVLNRLPGGFRWLKRNVREHVVLYFDTMANVLEEKLINKIEVNYSELLPKELEIVTSMQE
jgi:hypothetical protein